MDWVRTSFPESVVSCPGRAYLRLRHPVTRIGGRAAEQALPDDLLFFDLETLGLRDRPLFLVGVLHLDRRAGRWEVLQFFARNYDEEGAVIRGFLHLGHASRRWVTYNGSTFDLPFLRERAAFHRVRMPGAREHIDLLRVARRLYRGVLPDCRLSTVESWVLGHHRRDDIPGALIPSAYHAFVRTGDPADMRRVLRHNHRDLISLAALYAHVEMGESEA
jgi:uncharacterized protein YprB with RNaseH-like and TPR domain